MTVPSEENPNSQNQKVEEAATTTIDHHVVVTPSGIEAAAAAADDDDDDNAEENDPLADRDPKSLDSRERRLLHWQQSPFAVGCVNVTWQDDRYWFRPEDSTALDRNAHISLSAYICGCLGAKRVGNLAVLAQTMEEYDHVEVTNEATGELETTRRKRPRLLWVVGPYWPVNLCLTYPLIIGVSLLTGFRSLRDSSIPVIVTWSLCTFLLLFALAMIACRNPGVLYRHSQRPPAAEDWRWNDQAKSYRPPDARFDPECQAIIEGFDHTCPWTGTAIGSKNMFWFRIFVCMVPVCIAYSVILNVFNL